MIKIVPILDTMGIVLVHVFETFEFGICFGFRYLDFEFIFCHKKQ